MKKNLFIMLMVLGLICQPLAAQQSKSEKAWINYYQAAELYDQGSPLEQVIDILRSNVKEFPGHIESYLFLRFLYPVAGDEASAVKMLDMAIKKNHKDSGYSDMDTLRDRDDFKSLVKEYKAIFDEGRQNYTKSCDDNTM